MSSLPNPPAIRHVILKNDNEWCANKDDLIQLIKDECSRIIRSGDKLAKNYSFQNLDLDGHFAFDLLLDDQNQIMGWCGLYNGGRYPDGVFRAMNRLYLNPRLRANFFQAHTRPLYFDQARRNREKIRFLFISRNLIKGKYHLRRWVKYNSGEPGWEVSDLMIKVAPCEKKSCYQYIAFKNFANVNWPTSGITEQEWLALED